MAFSRRVLSMPFAASVKFNLGWITLREVTQPDASGINKVAVPFCGWVDRIAAAPQIFDMTFQGHGNRQSSRCSTCNNLEPSVFARMMKRLASKGTAQKTIIIDAIDRKADSTVSSLRAKGGADDQRGRLIGWTQGGLNTKRHAVTLAKGGPLNFFITAVQVSDYTRAADLSGSLPDAEWMLADWRCDANGLRDALKETGIKPGSLIHLSPDPKARPRPEQKSFPRLCSRSDPGFPTLLRHCLDQTVQCA